MYWSWWLKLPLVAIVIEELALCVDEKRQLDVEVVDR